MLNNVRLRLPRHAVSFHEESRYRMQSCTVPFVALLVVLVLPHLVGAAESIKGAEPQNGHGITAVTPARAATDTSMLTGSGLNTKSWAIDKVAPGGVLRKDPGSRTRYFVKGLTDVEMKQQYERYLKEMLAKHGNELRDVVIAVRDSIDVLRLRQFKLAVTPTLPCTITARIPYKHAYSMRKQGIVLWGKGDRRPDEKRG